MRQERGRAGARRYTFPRRPRLNMLHFLKKHLKPSQELEPLENPAPQITDTDAERGGESEGDYRSGKISELMRRMELIWPSYQMGTTEGGVVGSQMRKEGSRTGGFLRGVPRLRLVRSAVECGCQGLHLLPIPIALQGQAQRCGGSGVRSRQPSRDAPDLHPTERDSIQTEHDNRGPAVG